MIINFHTNFYRKEWFLFELSPDTLEICEINLKLPISSAELTVPGYLRLFRKDSSLQMHALGIYVREHISLERELSRVTLDYSYIGFRILVLNSVSYLFLLYRFHLLWDSLLLDIISDIIDKSLYLNTSSQPQELRNLLANI